jgi:hypothetical protein
MLRAKYVFCIWSNLCTHVLKSNKCELYVTHTNAIDVELFMLHVELSMHTCIKKEHNYMLQTQMSIPITMDVECIGASL